MKLGLQVGLGRGHIVLDGDPARFPKKRAEPSIFGPCLMAAWVKMPLGMEVALGPSDFVLDGDPVPLPKKGRSPQFIDHLYCGQTTGWIKMALGMEVGLDLGHGMLDGDPATLPKRGHSPPPNFRPMSIVAKRLDAPICHLVWM